MTENSNSATSSSAKRPDLHFAITFLEGRNKKRKRSLQIKQLFFLNFSPDDFVIILLTIAIEANHMTKSSLRPATELLAKKLLFFSSVMMRELARMTRRKKLFTFFGTGSFVESEMRT